ncbi:Endonuclease IV [Nucleospora cyclopteri]
MSKLLGAHLSISKGIHSVQLQMDNLKCDTCAIFLKNQRRFSFKPLEEEVVEKCRKSIKNPSILLPHGSYLINLANDKEERSYKVFLDDLIRCNQLEILLYNFHPGSNTQKNLREAIENLSKAINKAHKEVPNVIICIENMAGQGNVLGRTFEELAEIIKLIEDKERIGITLDTCHLFGGGYDIRTRDKFKKVMDEFDQKVGLKYLKAMHLNDSKCVLDSRKDRHEHLGKGFVGLEAFKFIMESELFDNIPLILETPDPAKYKEEIDLLRQFEKNIS